MSRITVFFVNNHAVDFDRDKVSFCDSGNCFFDFSEIEKKEEEKMYSFLVKDGRALVNWDNVAFVRESREKHPDDD